MRINENDLERRLGSSRNLVNKVNHLAIVKPARNGRGASVPTSLKITAGALAIQTSITETSEALGISKSVVRESMDSKNPVVRDGVDSAIEKVQNLALDRLITSLGLMTNDRLEGGSLKELSRVSTDMSRIVANTAPRSQVANVQLVIYSPTQRDEKSYDIIDV